MTCECSSQRAGRVRERRGAKVGRKKQVVVGQRAGRQASGGPGLLESKTTDMNTTNLDGSRDK